MEQFNQDELVHDYKAGDEKAFDKVYKRYYRPIYHRCFLIINDDIGAQEVAGDCLMAVWKNRLKVENYQHLEALLFLNARNLSLNYVRHQNTLKEKFYDVFPGEWTSDMVSNPIEYNNVLETIEEEISKMDTGDQLIAEYLVFHDLRPEEIAELVGKSKQTIQNKKPVILKVIREALTRRDLPVWF